MTSEKDLYAIAEALAPEPGQLVLEIGPGTGALTKMLLGRGAQVLAVEKDKELAARFKKEFEGRAVDLWCGDILDVRPENDFKLKRPIPVIGNIPYNITTPILEWLIEQRRWVPRAVLTVQWEVGKRIAAKPGNKDWGSLSVFLQFYADVELLFKIDKSHFFPAPKVDSGVIRLRFLPKGRFLLKNESFFFFLVRRAFNKRRKTLLNALCDAKDVPSLQRETLRAALETLKIDSRRRPETLALSEWAALSDSLGSTGQK